LFSGFTRNNEIGHIPILLGFGQKIMECKILVFCPTRGVGEGGQSWLIVIAQVTTYYKYWSNEVDEALSIHPV